VKLSHKQEEKMFAVITKDNQLIHMGDDREIAMKILEGNPGSKLEKPESADDYARLFKQINITPHACRQDSAKNCEPTTEEIEQMISEIGEAVGKRLKGFSESVWTTLGGYGVTKEKVSSVLEQVYGASEKAAAEAELGGKQGLAKIGELLVQAGNAVNELAKYKNRTK
jgi:hypothetical protein